VDDYRMRAPKGLRFDRRGVGLSLNSRHWELLDREAAERELTMSYLITRIVRGWCEAKSDAEVNKLASQQVKAAMLAAKEGGKE
jgi:predicted DNA-binding ribbon-helix-helix protein